MIIEKNKVLHRPQQKPVVWDVFYQESPPKKPLVVFCHGYKGFKDWGAWDLVAKAFAQAGFFFVKFNFSHNGGTVEQPIDFPDLNAFGENNYSKELKDLDDVLNCLLNQDTYTDHIDASTLILIGHSRGGGIVTLKSAEDSRITHLISWAGVCDFGKRTATIGDLDEWKKEGVKYVMNGRTKQMMPHFYQFYVDFKENEERLHIESATKQIDIPHLIVHAEGDPSVKFEEAQALHTWNPNSVLYPIKDSDHVFDARHPWDKDEMPAALADVVEQSIRFVSETLHTQ